MTVLSKTGPSADETPFRTQPASVYRQKVLALAAAAVSFLVLYWGVLVKLVHDWATDDNYSHGFFIVPIALYFAYERLDRLKRTDRRPSILGLIVIVGSLAVLTTGILGAELFLTRISIIGLLVGTTLFIGGWPVLRVLALPLGFLLLMIPLPAIIFNQIAFPLQLVASKFGEWTLHALSIPVLREGNVIILPNTTLEVAEACSGIRSLISLLTLGIVIGYFSDARTWTRVAVALATVPVAIVANGARVAGTGVAAYRYGPAAAEGFLHTFSGWLVFIVAIALLFAVQRALLACAPGQAASRLTSGAAS